MAKLIKLLKIKRELVFYGIFGLGSTVINIISFGFLRDCLKINLITANVCAWILAFIFSFVTNKIFVFGSKTWGGQTAVREFFEFLFARLLTLGLDTGILLLMVQKLRINQMLSKIIDNIIIILVNYILSKFWIFAKQGV